MLTVCDPAKAVLHFKMEISTKANSLTTSEQGKAFINLPMATAMKENI